MFKKITKGVAECVNALGGLEENLDYALKSAERPSKENRLELEQALENLLSVEAKLHIKVADMKKIELI